MFALFEGYIAHYSQTYVYGYGLTCSNFNKSLQPNSKGKIEKSSYPFIQMKYVMTSEIIKKETWNFHETGRDGNIKYSEGRLARLGNQRTEDTNVAAHRLRIAKYRIRRYINFLLYIIIRWMKYFFFSRISCKNVFEKVCNKTSRCY